MQALARNVRQLCELLETQRCIDEITKDHPCRIGLTADKQRRRLIKKLLRKCRVSLDSSNDRLFEITRQCYCPYLFGRFVLSSDRAAAFLTLYSA